MTETTTNVDRAKLRELAEQATPGPWDASGWVYGNADTESYGVWAGEPDGSNGIPLAKTSRLERGHRDAEFIAAANPGVVLALLDALTQAETERDREAP